MREVHLTMRDTTTGKIVYRSIDITNAMSSGSECWELKGPEDQRKNILNWIKERGNQQHNTTLSLVSWCIQ